jgi:hypothetical protein
MCGLIVLVRGTVPQHRDNRRKIMADTTVLVAGMVEVVKELIANHNAKVLRIQKAGNVTALVHEVRDDVETTDPKVQAYREWFEKAQAEILRKQGEIEEYILNMGLVDVEPVDVEAETKKLKESGGQIKAMLTTLGSFGVDVNSEEMSIPAMLSVRGGNAAGSSGPRPRISETYYRVAGTEEWIEVYSDKTDKDGVVTRSASLTVLAQALNRAYGAAEGHVDVTVRDLNGPLFESAGTRDLKSLNGTPVDFVFTVDNVNLEIKVIPKA